MQRDVEREAQLSPSSDEETLVFKQKPAPTQVRDKGEVVTLKQRKARQLDRLAEELKVEWEEARLQQVRDREQLYLAHLLNEGTGQATGHDLNVDEYNQRETPKHMKAKERNRASFRKEKGHRGEHPRQHPKSRKKAKCSERRGSTKARGPNSTERGKGKRVSSSKSNGGYQHLGPRVSRGADLAKLCPLLAVTGEIEDLEEGNTIQKETPQEGRRLMGRGTSRFAQSINQNSRDQRLWDKTSDLEQPLLLNSTFKQEATPQGAPCKYSHKNQWYKEIESAFEELFNTNRKLKKHLNLHLEQRLKVDQNPDEQQTYLETQGETSDTLREESTEEVEATEVSGNPVDGEAPDKWSKTSLKQLLGETEYPRYQQMVKHPLKSGSLMPVSEVGASVQQDNLFSESLESEQEPLKLASVEEKLAGSVSSWLALRQKQKAELEQRRQKSLLGMTEHPDMSLEIHYKAELEEERKERRRMRLAMLKSYPSGNYAPVHDRSTSLDGDIILDEDRQSEMIRDLQQQILEQNKLHKEFLEKARKRLQEFQKTF